MTKQDILNAFRERFGEHEVLCGLEEYPHAKCSCEYPEIIKWLLTTLTEFEREIREDMFKIDQPTLGEAQRKFEQLHHKADSLVVNKLDGVIQAIYYSPTAQMRKTAIEDSLSQLEKEKHPKK